MAMKKMLVNATRLKSNLADQMKYDRIKAKYDRIKAKNDAEGRPSGPRPEGLSSKPKPGLEGTLAAMTREIARKYPSAANGGMIKSSLSAEQVKYDRIKAKNDKAGRKSTARPR